MNMNKPFTGGITSLLQVVWQLELLSPMHIRGNQNAFLKNKREGQKGRLTELDLCYLYDEQEKDRKKTSDAYSQVTDFNYEFEIRDGKIVVKHAIPASSIRGALRGATLRSFIPPGSRNKFDPASKKGLEGIALDELIQEIKKELTESQLKWNSILSLFGSAFDVPGENEEDLLLTWAGRLRLETEFRDDGSLPLKIGGASVTDTGFPGNLETNVSTSSPLDRITMEARSGGLHSRIELSAGEKFIVKFSIRNLCKNDLQLIQFWQQQIEKGYLRFGGLQSQRRGRCKFVNQTYRLFAPKGAVAETLVAHLVKKEITENKIAIAEKDISSEIWNGWNLTLPQLIQVQFAEIDSLLEDE